MAQQTDKPRLSAEAIAAVERILADGNRVELMPTEDGDGFRAFEITRRELKMRRLTKRNRT